MIDKLLKVQIMSVVKSAVAQVMRESEAMNEKWLTAEELSEHFGMLSVAWLKKNGHRLPRTRAGYTDEDGVEHHSVWVYPRNKIQRMCMNGEIERL